MGHPDLPNVKGWVNFSSSPTADDRSGHGTHVAGIIGAANNGVGVVGVAPGTPLWSVKVFDDYGVSWLSQLIAGLEWVAENARAKGIKVANMSFGIRNVDYPAERDAIRLLIAAGVIPVAAAMNSGEATPWYPAAYPDVISVAATDESDQRAFFSNYGADWVDIAAPGLPILSTWVENGYAENFGTSMAAPFVAGTVALCLTSHVCKDPSQVLPRIGQDSKNIPGVGVLYRYGLVQADRYWLGKYPAEWQGLGGASETALLQLRSPGVRFHI